MEAEQSRKRRRYSLKLKAQIRPIALGRNNWLFAGSLRAGKRAAAVMSLIHSARLNGLAPPTPTSSTCWRGYPRGRPAASKSCCLIIGDWSLCPVDVGLGSKVTDANKKD